MNYVAYYRVSTTKQGISGLGLEGQQAIARKFAQDRGGVIVSEYVEVESGRNNFRLELHKAIQECKLNNCTLLVAKLDRLARNAAFAMSIKDSGVRLQICDYPDVDEFFFGMLAVLAQKEASTIRERVKVALAAKKARGEKLGNPKFVNTNQIARENSIEVRKEKAQTQANNVRAKYTARLLRDQGKTLREIAHELNNNKFLTSQGKQFHAAQVQRLLKN